METCILIVEDSPTQAQQIRLILEPAGYQVLVAPEGRQGLNMALKMAPDLVLLDVVLPDLDGYTVCRRLRQQEASRTPILMLTVRGSVEDRVDGLEVGADDYLAKPFDERELLARVHALLRTKRLRDELQKHLQEAHLSYQTWRQIAIVDYLTGLYNRHYFADVLEREFNNSQRYNTPLGCIMADIDHFRAFNNNYGHSVGDWVLQGVARILKENVRQADVVARYGGEEFVVLQPMGNREAAVDTASRLRELVGAKIWHSEAGELQVTISLGVAIFPEVQVANAKDLIACADQALYQAKQQGRNRMIIFTPSDDKHEQR